MLPSIFAAFSYDCYNSVCPDAIALIESFGRHVLVDGTFDLCELNLVLTTFMVVVNGIGVPVIWVPSNGKSSDDYIKSLKQIYYDHGGHLITSTQILKIPFELHVMLCVCCPTLSCWKKSGFQLLFLFSNAYNLSSLDMSMSCPSNF